MPTKQFFMPQVSKVEAESAYQAMKKSLSGQFWLPIADRRIQQLKYTNSKRKWVAEVGKPQEQEEQYITLAIFDSKQYIIYTRTTHGDPGPIILVDKNEVTSVEDFAPAAVK